VTPAAVVSVFAALMASKKHAPDGGITLGRTKRAGLHFICLCEAMHKQKSFAERRQKKLNSLRVTNFD
jgi:hypothetical protein